jgi:hypothetical protein
MIRILVAALVFSMTSTAAVKIEKTNYKGWPNCYRLSNGEVELVVTTDVGPRVMRYGFVNGQNLFKEFEAELGKSGERTWMPRGGHRIWIAPEDIKDTYALDNAPVKAELKGDTIVLTQPVEPETGLEKQITVKLATTGSDVEVTHRIRNTGKAAREFAPWALTMMAQDGFGITGFPPRGTHPEQLAPTNPLVMWAFTNLSDPRWTFTNKYMVLKQDRNNKGQPQKLGHFNPNTWGAYLLGSELYIKRYKADPKKTYTDMGASYETFTNAEMLELETLGPLTKVKPGEAIDHVESWTLHRNIKIDSFTDANIDKVLLPLLGGGIQDRR